MNCRACNAVIGTLERHENRFCDECKKDIESLMQSLAFDSKTAGRIVVSVARDTERSP